MFTAEVDDLKSQMLKAKRQNVKLQGENENLQKRVRKLTESSDKKSKMIDEFNENPPPLVGSLKEEISNLKKNLAGKDILIRNLQKDLDAIKAYYPKPSQSSLDIGKTKSSRQVLRSPSSRPLVSRKSRPITANPSKPSVENLPPEEIPTFTTDGTTTNRTQIRLRSSKLPTKIQHVEGGCNTSHEKFKQTRLEKFSAIKKDILGKQSVSKVDSELNNSDEVSEGVTIQDELQPETMQHSEIKELHTCFKDIVSEMKTLKESLCIIQMEQQKAAPGNVRRNANVRRHTDGRKAQIKISTNSQPETKSNKISENDLPTKPLIKPRFNSTRRKVYSEDIHVATKFGRVIYTRDDLVDNFENILTNL